VYRLTKPGSSEYYDLTIKNAEMFKIPFLGRFLQLAQYMYYVYDIKLLISDLQGTGVRSLEEQLGTKGLTPTATMSAHVLGIATDVNMKVTYKSGELHLTAKEYLLHFLWMLL